MREEGELRIIQPSPPDWVTPPPLLLCHSPTHSSFNPNIYIHPGFRLQKNPLLRGIKIRMYKKQDKKENSQTIFPTADTKNTSYSCL